jgi:hypothetical protein
MVTGIDAAVRRVAIDPTRGVAVDRRGLRVDLEARDAADRGAREGRREGVEGRLQSGCVNSAAASSNSFIPKSFMI